MDGIIRLTIPTELKNQFKQDKYLLEKLRRIGLHKTKKIEKYLNDNNIVELLNEISSVTKPSEYGHIKKEGFFKEFPEWLEFALKEILTTKGINISSSQKRKDMYLALEYSQEELNYVRDGDEFIRDKLITQSEYFIYHQRKDKTYNPEIKEMCSIFIDIALYNIEPNKLVNINYEAFLQAKKPQNILTRKRIK